MAPADIGFARFNLVLLGLASTQFMLVEPGAQHRHGFVLVAVLGTIVLALHDDAGWSVRDPHRRFGSVDVLTTGARGAVNVDAQIGRVDIDFDGIIDFRIHIDRGK